MALSNSPQRWSQAVAVVTLWDRPFWERSRRRRVGRAALWLLYLYLGVLVVLLALENYFLFQPSVYPDWEAAPLALHTVRDVELTSADGTALHAWWATPAGWRPEQGALLFCHGNGGNLSHRGWALLPWQNALNTAVLIFDYPGYGKSAGRPTERGCYAAGDAAYFWLAAVAEVPGDRILLYGESMGGAVATDLAVRRPHRALILAQTFTSFPDMAQKQYPWLPARWLVSNQMNNLAKIGRCTRPVFIAHGTADRLIPFAQAEHLFAAAGEPKYLFPLRGLDHADAPPAEYYLALRQFLEETAPLSAAQPVGD